jgi:hypothetical protein
MAKEPKDATHAAARLARAYPALSCYSAARLAEKLCAIERAQRRHAVRDCSEEWYTRGQEGKTPRDRAAKRIDRRMLNWLDFLGLYSGNRIAPPYSLEGDPRGAVLRIQFPGEPEAQPV